MRGSATEGALREGGSEVPSVAAASKYATFVPNKGPLRMNFGTRRAALDAHRDGRRVPGQGSHHRSAALRPPAGGRKAASRAAVSRSAAKESDSVQCR